MHQMRARVAGPPQREQRVTGCVGLGQDKPPTGRVPASMPDTNGSRTAYSSTRYRNDHRCGTLLPVVTSLGSCEIHVSPKPSGP